MQSKYHHIFVKKQKKNSFQRRIRPILPFLNTRHCQYFFSANLEFKIYDDIFSPRMHYGYSIVTFFTFLRIYLVGLRFLCTFASD